jgi:predicted transcriptional regulator
MVCACGKSTLSEEQKQILAALDKSKDPCGSKEIASATGIDAKAVGCKVTALKKKGLVDSPEKCKYALTDEGRSALKVC